MCVTDVDVNHVNSEVWTRRVAGHVQVQSLSRCWLRGRSKSASKDNRPPALRSSALHLCHTLP